MINKFLIKKFQIIRHQQMLLEANDEMTINEEPLPYCIKYNVGRRDRDEKVFRNKKWSSKLKCTFKTYRESVPLVLLVRLYVTPPSRLKLGARELKEEKTPASASFEICDYLLSFLEMFSHVLIQSYRQFVKIDVEKFYSSNPRTIFKFMTWEKYVKLQNNNSLQPSS